MGQGQKVRSGTRRSGTLFWSSDSLWWLHLHTIDHLGLSPEDSLHARSNAVQDDSNKRQHIGRVSHTCASRQGKA
jgi:hypothetical protein